VPKHALEREDIAASDHEVAGERVSQNMAGLAVWQRDTRAVEAGQERSVGIAKEPIRSCGVLSSMHFDLRAESV